MSTQYRLVLSGKTSSGGCSAGQGSSELSATDFYKLNVNIEFLFKYENVILKYT
jgi:hypothetical protein